MIRKTILIMICLIFSVSAVSAACSSCGQQSSYYSGGPTGNCNGECTDITIDNFVAYSDCTQAPCTVDFSGSTTGDVASVTFYVINSRTGSVECSSVASCGDGGCKAFCKISKPGVYDLVMKATGANGCCVTQTKTEDIVINSGYEGNQGDYSRYNDNNNYNGRHNGNHGVNGRHNGNQGGNGRHNGLHLIRR